MNLFARRLLILFLLTGFFKTGIAQQLITNSPDINRKYAADTTALSGFISKDLTLEGGRIYLIEHNVKIGQTATLTIKEGSLVLFNPGASIVVEGGLNLQGKPNNLIELTSRDPRNPGHGISLRGNKGKDINIQFCRFYRLKAPFIFDHEWYRKSVTISDNIFKHIFTGESYFLINSPYDGGNFTKANVRVLRNNFVNNWGSVFVEALSDDLLELEFKNNVLTNNVVYGLDLGIPSNSPIFGFYDSEERESKALIVENSFFGNYQINSAVDTVIREVGFGIEGEGEVFNIPQNFYRSQDPHYVSSTLNHFYQNNNLPLLTVEPLLSTPKMINHAHIWKARLDGKELPNYSDLPDFANKNIEVNLYFNRSVRPFDTVQARYVFFDTLNNQISSVKLQIMDSVWSPDRMQISFLVKTPDGINRKLGYLAFMNFKDDEGIEIPDFTIGQVQALNNYNRLLVAGKESKYFPLMNLLNTQDPGGASFNPSEEEIRALEQILELGDLSYLGAYLSLKKTWEIGLWGGGSNYMGDLTSKMVYTNTHLAGGIWGQYNISKWFSARLMLSYARVSGSDLDNEFDRKKKELRFLSFRSDIWELSGMFHFHALQYGVSKGEIFSPSLYVGFAAFLFDPKAQVLKGLNPETSNWEYYEEWHKLRPIGTEGQTIPGSGVKPYNRYAFAIPFGVTLDFILKKSWIVGLDLGVRPTLTDYLDDVSGFYYRPFKGEGFPDINNQNTGLDPQSYHTFWTLSDGLDPIPTSTLLSDPSISSRGLNNNAAWDDARNARGEPNNKDWYFFLGIKVSKVLGLKKRLY